MEKSLKCLCTSGGLEGEVSPIMIPGQSPSGELGVKAQENPFCSCLQNRRKLTHTKNEIVVLFCTMSATNMFTIQWINNFSFYVNWHVYYTSNQKLFLLLRKKCSWHFYKRTIWKQQILIILQIKSFSVYLKDVFLYISIKNE